MMWSIARPAGRWGFGGQWRISRIGPSAQVHQRGHHLVLRLDGLGVGLVGALCGHHAHQLGRQIHVGILQCAGAQPAELAFGGRAQHRLARLEGFHPVVAAHGGQALRVAEAGQRHLPLGARHTVGVTRHHRAVVLDADAREFASRVAVLRQVGHRERLAVLRHAVELDVHRVVGQPVRVGRGGFHGERHLEAGFRCGGGRRDDLAAVVELDLADRRGHHWRRGRGVVELVVHVPGVGAVLLEVQAHRLGHALAVVHVDGGAVGGARRGGHGRRGRGVAGGIGCAGVEVELRRDRRGLLGGDRLGRGEGQRRGVARSALARDRVQRIAHDLRLGVGHQLAVAVELEVAGTGVGARAVGLLQREEAVAVDGHVQAVAGHGNVALVELLRHRRQLHPDAGIGAARGADGIGHHLGEFGARGLEADGAGVGHVVADHVQVLAGGVEAGQALLEAHGALLGGRKRGCLSCGMREAVRAPRGCCCSSRCRPCPGSA